MNQKRHKNINFNTKIENVFLNFKDSSWLLAPVQTLEAQIFLRAMPCPFLGAGASRAHPTQGRKDPCLYGGKVTMTFIKSNLYF